MNKMMTVKGWLVVAAALTMGLTACSNDDNLTEAPVQPTNTSTMHVTVGAGIGDGTTTRATVDDSQTDGNGKTLRTLKFTEGDQLYVRYGGMIGSYGYDIYGILTTTGSSIGADGLTAQFSGDLTVQKWKWGDENAEQSSIPDPDLSLLTDCHFARLIPADHGASLVLEDRGDGIYDCFYREGLTATETLNEAIARHSLVSGEIDASQNVTLTAESAFLNCTVTGLDASTAYDVRMAKGADPVSMTTDGDGALHFVAWYRTEGGPMQYTFYVGNNKRVLLGEKTLTAGKVYNVNRAATAFTPLTVTDNATSTTVEPEYGSYSFKDGSANITVTGEGEGETIYLYDNNNTVTLSGVTATSYDRFIYAGGGSTGTLNIVLSGTNNITITDPTYGSQAIHAEGNLKLSGNGTLTVTVTAADFYGLYGSINYASYGGDPNNPDTNGDASVLAADGYTVSRSDVTHDSEKGTYTWTYTVAASE